MPVTKDSPVYDPRPKKTKENIDELRKNIVNKKNVDPKSPEQKRKSEKVYPGSVIPQHEFLALVEQARVLCKDLIVSKKGVKPGKDLGGAYKRKATELGKLLTGIVSTIKSTAGTVTDALTKANLVANSKLPVEALKAGRKVLVQLNGVHRQIKQLNDSIAAEIVKSKRGLEPKSIYAYLKDVKSIYETAEEARIDSDSLYRQWGPHINPGRKLEQRANLPAGSTVPKFVVNSKIVQVGEAKKPAEKKALEKIVKVKNLGGESFPDPYTTLWKYYSNKLKGVQRIHLDEDIRNIVRFSVLAAARASAQPKQNTVLEIYNNGEILGEKGGAEHFNAESLNENFRAVLASLIRKMKKDPKIKEKVFELYQRADDEKFAQAIAHLGKEGRGSLLTDNARKQYIEEVRDWFTTYLPSL
jgi:hypothetical protein